MFRRHAQPVNGEAVQGTIRGRFNYLLASLILLIILYPYFSTNHDELTVLNIFVSVILLFAVYAVAYSSRLFIIGVLLALPTFSAHWIAIFFHHPYLDAAGPLFSVIFYTFTTATLLMHLMRSNRVTANEVYGALCGYLLIGLIWSSTYWLIELFRPDSFVVVLTKATVNFSDLIYYSLSTLTTSGYGDILPITNIGKSLSTVEAVIGQIYLAVLVARFVGLFVAHHELTRRQAEK